MSDPVQNYSFVSFKSNINETRYSKRLHSHREVSLGYIEDGKTTITVDHQRYQLLPGDIVLILSETVHLCVPEDDRRFRYQMFYFDSDWWMKQFSIRPDAFITLAIPASEELKSLFGIIMKGIETNTVIEEQTRLVLTHLVDDLKYRKLDEACQEIDKIHQQIKEMPHISRTVEEMAEQAGLSKFSFIRKYAKLYGLTPHADLVNMRIQRAVLLLETNMELISIALDCGFADQSHFINQFKLYTGLRPGEYRQKLISGKNGI